jgi:hypothetical protein
VELQSVLMLFPDLIAILADRIADFTKKEATCN